MTIKFKQVARTAWSITRLHPKLWFWGLLASFIALETVSRVVLGNFVSLRAMTGIRSLVTTPHMLGGPSESLVVLFAWLGGHPRAFVGAVTLITIIILSAAISACAYAVTMTRVKLYGESPRARHLPHATESVRHVWQIIAITILARLVQYAIGILAYTPLIAAAFAGRTSLALAFVGGTIIFIACAGAVHIIATYAQTAVVVDEATLNAGIARGWELFTKRPIFGYGVWMALVGARVGALLLAFLVCLMVALPLVLLYLIMQANGVGVASAFLLIAGGLIAGLILIAVHMIFATYYVSLWTCSYLALKPDSFLVRALRAAQAVSSKHPLERARAELERLQMLIERTRTPRIRKKQ